MSVITYKCPNCGGDLQFNPEGQNFKCEYCLSEFTEEELENLPSSQAVIYSCPNCGAEIITDETTAATTCYYCHNPIVMAGRLSGKDEPDWVIPFAIDRGKAEEIFTSWMKKKRFLPDSFFAESQVEKISGIYFPYLLYNCMADGKMTAQCSRVRTWTTGNIQYTETEQFEVERQGRVEVSNLTRNALKKADKLLVESVLPFNMEALKKFRMAYLSGFAAEKKDMERGDFEAEVKQEVDSYVRNSLRNSFTGYTSVAVEETNTKLSEEVWKYALLPVWTFVYQDKARNKMYYCALNGQTGKTCGKLSVDNKKLVCFFLEIFIPLFLMFLAAGYFI